MINLKKDLLADVTDLYRPETILGWHRQLVGKKYDRYDGKKPGPVSIFAEYSEMVLKMSGSNPEWRYARIADCMTHLSMKVSVSTVKRVRGDRGVVPDPERKKPVDWNEFIQNF